MNLCKYLATGLACALVGPTFAQTTSLELVEFASPIGVADTFVNDPVPAGAYTVQLLLTSDADVQGFEIVLTAPADGYYNHSFGTADGAPNVAFGPAAQLDTFVDLPGGATILPGSGFDADPAGGDLLIWGDLSTNVPVTGFKVLQVTLLGFDPLTEQGTITGRYTVAGATAPVDVQVNETFGVPEPGSLALLGLGGLALLRRRR